MPPNHDYYIDTSSSYLSIILKVTKANGSSLDATDNVGFCNLLGTTLFKSAALYLKEALVSSVENFNYIAYMKATLSYPKEIKSDQMTESLYYFDDKPDTITNNTSFNKRVEVVKGSASVQIATPLFLDFFECGQKLIGDFGLKLVLNRASEAFCLLSEVQGAAYKLVLEQCDFIVRKVKPAKEIIDLNTRFFDKNEIHYPFTNSCVKTVNISKAQVNYSFDNLFANNQLPDIIIFGLVREDSYNGKYGLNPFNFSRFNLTEVSLNLDGVPTEAYTFKLENSNYLPSYHSFIREIQGQNLGITRENYLTGNTFLAFRFYHKQGSLAFNLKFGDGGAAENLTGILLARYSSSISGGIDGIFSNKTII